jgi:hypothetical protein
MSDVDMCNVGRTDHPSLSLIPALAAATPPQSCLDDGTDGGICLRDMDSFLGLFLFPCRLARRSLAGFQELPGLQGTC